MRGNLTNGKKIPSAGLTTYLTNGKHQKFQRVVLDNYLGKWSGKSMRNPEL